MTLRALQFPSFALLYAAYPAAYIAVTNPGQVTFAPVAAVIFAMLASSLAAVAALRLPMRTWDRAGVAALWLTFLFYVYGPVNAWWLGITVAMHEQQAVAPGWAVQHPHAIQSALWVLAFVLGLLLLRRIADAAMATMRGLLNVSAVALLALLAVQAAGEVDLGPAARDAPPAAGLPQPVVADRGALPDIYFVVLDGYSRADVLAQYYGYDNEPFLDALRSRGFRVAAQSRANYNWTFLSLGSALNLDYVQPLLGDHLDRGGDDREHAYDLLRDNRAAAFLRQAGYRFVQLQSTWGGTGVNPHADEFVPCQAGVFGNEYLRAFTDTSWLRAFSARETMDLANCHLRNLASLAAQGARPGPKFVFAHFLPPHHPYLFDRHGQVLRRANLSDQFEFQKQLWESRESYVEQLEFISGRVLDAVDRILADSPRPPVIVLISDHGPNLRQGLSAQEHRRVRLANFSAVRLPGAPEAAVPDDTTLVNLLRRIFNHYFAAGLPLLPDRYFVSPYSQPFDLVEVGGNGERLEAQASPFDKM